MLKAASGLLPGSSRDGVEGAALPVRKCKTLNNSWRTSAGRDSFNNNRCVLVFNG